MKKTILYILFVCSFVSNGFAYTYEVDTYGDSKTLNDTESILVDQQGGMFSLTLRGETTADVLGTSDLAEGSGGIWEVNLFDWSSFNFLGGEIHLLSPNNNAAMLLSGGLIQEIWSSQYTSSGPHITIECLDHFYDTNTKILTGHWLDVGNTAFSIQLVDVAGYDPAIQNIQFIPEPTTLVLLGLGGLLLKRKK